MNSRKECFRRVRVDIVQNDRFKGEKQRRDGYAPLTGRDQTLQKVLVGSTLSENRCWCVPISLCSGYCIVILLQ